MYYFWYNSQIKCFRTHLDTDSFCYFWYVGLEPKVCPPARFSYILYSYQCGKGVSSSVCVFKVYNYFVFQCLLGIVEFLLAYTLLGNDEQSCWCHELYLGPAAIISNLLSLRCLKMNT
jgi:hypothetical protein